MPFNLLLLPLLGGYIFVSNCNYTKFHLLRYDGNRLLIPGTVISGAGCLIASSATVALLKIYAPGIIAWWHHIAAAADLHFPYLGTTLLSFVYGAMLWLPANALYPEKKAIVRAIRQHRDPLELMLYDAFANDALLSLSLKNGKVYVGWLAALQAPGNSQRIAVLPLMSGYRKSEDKTVVISTYYSGTYEKMLSARDSGYSFRSIDDFAIVLPVAEILTVSKFDPGFFYLSRTDDD